MINIIIFLAEGKSMADVKCGRCDRYYSKFRSRCPYCGALRSNKGKRASSGDNATWKVVVGVGILAILIAAVIAVLYTTYAPKNESGSGDERQATQADPADSGGVISATDDDADNGIVTPTDDDAVAGNGTDTPTGDDTTVDNGTVAPTENAVQSVAITYGGNVKTDIILILYDSIRLSYRAEPENAGLAAVWSSSDENVVSVTQGGAITANAVGSASVYVTVGDKTAECTVKVNGR